MDTAVLTDPDFLDLVGSVEAASLGSAGAVSTKVDCPIWMEAEAVVFLVLVGHPFPEVERLPQKK